MRLESARKAILKSKREAKIYGHSVGMKVPDIEPGKFYIAATQDKEHGLRWWYVHDPIWWNKEPLEEIAAEDVLMFLTDIGDYR